MEVKNYEDAEKDLDGWTDAKLFQPKIYDLVHLAFDNNRILTGWWNGREWCCRKNKKNKKVMRWKKTSHLNC
jgi:hypothetical protein